MDGPIALSNVGATRPAATVSAYRLRLAQSASDLRNVQALRFQVFNLELDEGLVESYDSGLDADPFDAICDHLLIEDTTDGSVVGTYRMQTGLRARAALGYYSEQAFDFTPFEAQRGQLLELGRACIAQRHRNFAALNLLWRGIAGYAQSHGSRYLIGCSSLTSQDPAVGAAAYRQLRPQQAPAAWQTRPRAAFACPLLPSGEVNEQAEGTPVKIPKLLAAYLALGAGICGPPAIDRAFGTLDFLTWLDLESPKVQSLRARGRFVG